MAATAVDPTTGQRYVRVDGEWQPLNVEGVTDAVWVQAGAQLRQFGRGIQSAFGADRDQLAMDQRADDARLAPVNAAYPVASFIGEALPSLATAPISGGAGLIGRALVQGGVGAAEGAIELDPYSATQTGSVVRNAIGSVLGEAAGSMAGRVYNAIRGFGRQVDITPAAERLEAVGGRATQGQRLGDTQVQAAETSAASNVFLRGPFDDIAEQNQRVANEAAARAIGLGGGIDQLGPDALDQAARSAESVFNRVEGSIGQLDIGEEFAEEVLSLEQFRKLRGLNRMPRLQQGIIEPGDYITVRQALAEEMGRAYDKGQGQLGNEIRARIDRLDALADAQAPAELLPEFARAREQWRVIRLLERTNMLSGGNVNPVSFDKAIRREFGTAATRGRGNQVVNQETRDMIETFGALTDPDVRPIVGNSGTAERLQITEAFNDLGGTALQLGAAVPLRAAQESPRATSAISALLYQNAPAAAGLAGAAAGRGTVDPLYQLLYGQDQP